MRRVKRTHLETRSLIKILTISCCGIFLLGSSEAAYGYTLTSSNINPRYPIQNRGEFNEELKCFDLSSPYGTDEFHEYIHKDLTGLTKFSTRNEDAIYYLTPQNDIRD